MDMVSSKSIKIACPYLGHEPFTRVLRECSAWQLLTDIDELLRNLVRAERQWFIDLLNEDPSRVRHNQNLHAKVVVAGQHALVGSANLTARGLTRRAEMAVLISDRATVAELNAWFDELWDGCDEIKRDAIHAIADFAAKLPPRSSSERNSSAISLPTGPRIMARLVRTQKSHSGHGRGTNSAATTVYKPAWRASTTVTVRVDDKPVEWNRTKACILHALQSVGPKHKGLTKPEVGETIWPSTYSDKIPIHKLSRELIREGFVFRQRRKGHGNNYFYVPTPEGMRVKLPPAKHLVTR